MKYYLPHIILLGVFLAALVPVLYYYQRRNPNPKFRPGVGEITLVVVMALAVGVPVCYLLGNFFRGGADLKRMQENPNEGAGWSSGTSAPPKEDGDAPRYRTE